MVENTTVVLRGMEKGFRIREQVYFKVDLRERYPGDGNHTIRGLAKAFVLHPGKIVRTLLSDTPQLRTINEPAFEELFAQNYRMPGGPGHKKPKNRQERKEYLRNMLSKRPITSAMHHGYPNVEPDYYQWTLPNRFTIALPISTGFADVLTKSKRWDALEAQADAFQEKVNELADAVIELRKALTKLSFVGKHGLHEVGMLVGLSQYCDLLLDQEGNPQPGDSPLADFQEFLQRSAIPLFNEHIVRNPVDIEPDAARRRDRFARKIMKILDDPDFTAGVKLVVENHDIMPHKLLSDMYDFMTAGADLLSATEQAEKFAVKHALPLMRGLADLPASECDEAIQEFHAPALRTALAGGWRDILPERETVFKLAMGIGTAAIGSVSNLEGPRSIGVAGLIQYQLYLFKRAAKEYNKGVAAFNHAVFKFETHFGNIKAKAFGDFYQRLAAAARSGDKVDISALLKESKIHLARGPFRGRTTRAAMALLAISVFGLAVASNPDNSMSSAFAIASTFGTMGVATLDWAPIANALERRWGGAFTSAVGGLAGVVAIVGFGTSFASFWQACEDGDDLGIAEGALGTIGSSASIVGWLWSLKAGALAFAPSLLMTTGSILILAGLGVSIWRTFDSEEPEDVVLSTLNFFDEPESRASIAGLAPTLETLNALAKDVDFKPLGRTYEEALYALGYDDGTVAILRGLG